MLFVCDENFRLKCQNSFFKIINSPPGFKQRKQYDVKIKIQKDLKMKFNEFFAFINTVKDKNIVPIKKRTQNNFTKYRCTKKQKSESELKM
jgi:hypothetical protein